MLDSSQILVIGNLAVITGYFIATLYRIKIEKKQTEIQAENAEAKKCLVMLRKHIKVEKEDILKMDQKDLKEFLDGLEHLGEE